MLRTNIRLIISSLCSLLATSIVWAIEPISAPYSMGFESTESAEMANWVINPGDDVPGCMDKWYVGNAVHCEGVRSLYISDNEGLDAQYGSVPNVQYVYRDFTIPTGQYDVSFDYQCMGGQNQSYMLAGVTFISAVENDMKAKNGSSSVPSSVQSAAQLKSLHSASHWKNASFSFTAKSETTLLRLFFVWSSSNTDPDHFQPLGACVDNVQITSRSCSKPYDVAAMLQNDSVVVTWSGTSESYVMERRRRGTTKWYTYGSLSDKKVVLEGLAEGAWDFRVRGVCNDVDTSAYAYLNSFIVFYPDRHCVDYVHLNSENIHGTIGTFKDPYQMIDTIVDFGEEQRSRHTVILNPDLYDPRTDNELPMIPDGEWASIRLGNWAVSSQAESLSFDIDVDEESALLLIKYAVVMQDPNHDAPAQPRFTLEILDEDGYSVSTCGEADFTADINRKGWHSNKARSVTWKDWTTLGLNLWELDLAGKRVTVRFTTYDCSMGGHYGYAYFTLGCARARLSGTSCGSDTIMNIQAPDGFDYKWYNKYDEFVSDSCTLAVPPSDTTTYRCYLSYKEAPECGFNLYCANKPRYPYADFEWKWIPSNCENKMQFVNKSHVYIQVDDYVEHTDEPCEEYQWFVNGKEASPDVSPTLVFPNHGGLYDVHLMASIADGHCEADTIIQVMVPSIGDTVIVVDSVICEGGYVVWGDRFADKMEYAALDSTYTASWVTSSGCDSVRILNLTTRPVTTEYVGDTTVCAEVPLVVDGMDYKLKESGKFYRFYQNQYGCDSTVWMDVTVLDSIKPVVRVQEMTDEPNSGAIYISGEGFDYYTVNDGDPIPWSESMDLTGLNGGEFKLDFYNEFGCSIEAVYKVSDCLPKYVYQRWENVLSLKDSAVMASVDTAYQFVNFQWYCNDVAMEGDTLSYLYVEKGFKEGDYYYVEMTRVSTGERVQTCPFVPTVKNEKNKVVVYPSPVHVGGQLTVKTEKAAKVTFVTLLGEIVSVVDVAAGTNQVTAPTVAGIYIVQVESEDEVLSCQISVIE